jgi:YHS domain-containing protein
MSEASSLESRIDAEFSAAAEKLKNLRAEGLEDYHGRQQRLEQLGKVFDELRDLWKPRLDVLVKKFGDHVEATPRIVPSTREVTFEFQSKLARVRLKLSASTDRDVRKLILSYDLDIIPVLLRFEPHADLEFPLEKVNKEAVAKWLDDRILDFVRTYLSVGDSEVYLKDHMVEDPITQVRFPNFAAGATLQWQGKTYYFIGDETRREFARKNGIAVE